MASILYLFLLLQNYFAVYNQNMNGLMKSYLENQREAQRRIDRNEELGLKKEANMIAKEALKLSRIAIIISIVPIAISMIALLISIYRP